VVAHHRLSIEIACPSCGASGTVKVAEDAGPPFTDAPRRTYSTDPDKFALISQGDPLQIQCVACGGRFPRTH
jgi:hypothetical protein